MHSGLAFSDLIEKRAMQKLFQIYGEEAGAEGYTPIVKRANQVR